MSFHGPDAIFFSEELLARESRNVLAFAIDQPEDTPINAFAVGPANQPW